MEALKKDEEIEKAKLEVVKDDELHEAADEQALMAAFLGDLIGELKTRSKRSLQDLSEKLGKKQDYLRRLKGRPSDINKKVTMKTLIDGFLQPWFARFLTPDERERIVAYRQKTSPIKTKDEYEEKIKSFIRGHYDPSVALEVLALTSCRFGVREDTLIARGNLYLEAARELQEAGLLIFSHGYFSLIFNGAEFLTRDMVKSFSDILFRKIKKPKKNYNYLECRYGYVSKKDYQEIYKLLYKAKELFKKAEEDALENTKQEVPVAMVNLFASLGEDVNEFITDFDEKKSVNKKD